MSNSKITVLGAGSYGTALAISIAEQGHDVMLWARCSQHVETMQQSRCNEQYLGHIAFPESLQLTHALEAAVQFSTDILLVVPSHVYGLVVAQLQPLLTKEHRLIWATKGLEPETGRLLQEVARDYIDPAIPLAVFSGPTFAKELASGMPTAISVASTDAKLASDMAELLHNEKNLRVYVNADFIGLQIGGAVKNVIAIAAGMSDGLGFGANARTALITRGLTEMQRLGVALGASPETFMGMSGLGDLVLTCTDNQSRNRRYGLALGKGVASEAAQAEIGQVVEGYRNAKEVYVLSQRLQVEMPIVEQVYAVLYQQQPAHDVALNLLKRTRKSEHLASK
jgi:glycerol-3-phosphate dehydrogenase (NAD(P)+)